MRPTTLIVVVAVMATLAGCSGNPVGSPATTPSRTPVSSTTATAITTAVAPTVAPTDPPAAVDPDAGEPLVDRVHWTTTSKGSQLQIFPTQAGRTDAAVGAGVRAWAEVLAQAPTANTPGMYDQFLCHWNFARIVDAAKPSWDLEPWRPAIGYAATVAARCNPGGSEG